MYAAETQLREEPQAGLGKLDSIGAETLLLGAPVRKKPPPTDL